MQQNPTNQSSQIGPSVASLEGIVSTMTPVTADCPSSLTQMAQRDLDAALQLLADRAQYITGASGAAIALRRDGRKDMLCRASSGSNAPELGALLSAEFGLSGESVRTRRLLRCDDAERDARVNREVCRQLGIASVVVMPVVNDDEVLGVFELFSGKTHAFGERDLSAVQRLSEMVEAAVRLAKATEALPAMLKTKGVAPEPVAKTEEQSPDEDVLEVDVVGPTAVTSAPETTAADTTLAKATDATEQGSTAKVALSDPVRSSSPTEAVKKIAAVDSAKNPDALQQEQAPSTSLKASVDRPTSEKDLNLDQLEVTPSNVVAEPVATPMPEAPVPVAQASSSVQQAQAPHKPLLWSAAPVAGENAEPGEDQSNVPPILRGLKKCEACGFPISGGRVLCVECEEKKWRGQLRKPAGAPMPTGALPANSVGTPEAQALAAVAGSGGGTSSAVVRASVADLPVKAAAGFIKSPQDVSPATVKAPAQPAKVSSETPIFSAGLAPSQSWLARNKYVLGVLLVVAAAIAGVIFLR